MGVDHPVDQHRPDIPPTAILADVRRDGARPGRRFDPPTPFDRGILRDDAFAFADRSALRGGDSRSGGQRGACARRVRFIRRRPTLQWTDAVQAAHSSGVYEDLRARAVAPFSHRQPAPRLLQIDGALFFAPSRPDGAWTEYGQLDAARARKVTGSPDGYADPRARCRIGKRRTRSDAWENRIVALGAATAAGIARSDTELYTGRRRALRCRRRRVPPSRIRRRARSAPTASSHDALVPGTGLSGSASRRISPVTLPYVSGVGGIGRPHAIMLPAALVP